MNTILCAMKLQTTPRPQGLAVGVVAAASVIQDCPVYEQAYPGPWGVRGILLIPSASAHITRTADNLLYIPMSRGMPNLDDTTMITWLDNHEQGIMLLHYLTGALVALCRTNHWDLEFLKPGGPS